MARIKFLPAPRPVKVGQKVKVYHNRHTYFGEVIGIRKEGKLVLGYRDDFRDLPVSAFDHYREMTEVVFLNLPEAPASDSREYKPREVKPAVNNGCTYQVVRYSWEQYKRFKEVNNG